MREPQRPPHRQRLTSHSASRRAWPRAGWCLPACWAVAAGPCGRGVPTQQRCRAEAPGPEAELARLQQENQLLREMLLQERDPAPPGQVATPAPVPCTEPRRPCSVCLHAQAEGRAEGQASASADAGEPQPADPVQQLPAPWSRAESAHRCRPGERLCQRSQQGRTPAPGCQGGPQLL